MERLLKDLFPPSLRQAAMTIFGEPAVAAILLRQPATGTDPIELPADCIPVATLLHSNERAKLTSYRLAKRRAEFLTGRVCAKLAIERFWTTKDLGNPLQLSKVEIASAPSGRPMVCGDDLEAWSSPEISISHAGEYAAALAAQRPCGIDLQEQKANLLRVREKYCSLAELQVLAELFPEIPLLSRLCLLWTAKEAAKKALSSVQMPGFLELELTRSATNLHDCHSLVLAVRVHNNAEMPVSVTVIVTTFDNYGLAICILNKDQHHA
jgi:4'-phosphopantetheinyl transferase EntD